MSQQDGQQPPPPQPPKPMAKEDYPIGMIPLELIKQEGDDEYDIEIFNVKDVALPQPQPQPVSLTHNYYDTEGLLQMRFPEPPLSYEQFTALRSKYGQPEDTDRTWMMSLKVLNENLYVCTECNFRGPDYWGMKLHIEVQHFRIEHSCMFCPTATGRGPWIFDDILNCTDFLCPDCHFYARQAEVLANHMETVHKNFHQKLL